MSGDWTYANASAALAPDEVHVYRASLDLPREQVERLMRTLSADERARVARFHFERDRLRYVAAHGQLRTVLGGCLGVAPGAVAFAVGPYGKPHLPPPSDLHFNMSHSHEWALFAVTRNRRLGVDIERISAHDYLLSVAVRFFSRNEVAALRKVPEARRAEAFTHCWARKEAYIKAIGMGLSLPLDSFDVSLVPGEPALLLRAEHDPQAPSRWALTALAPAPGYLGALAVEGHGWRLRQFDLSRGPASA